MTESLHNCRFYWFRTIISNYSSEVKWKLIKIWLKSGDFSAFDLHLKNFILEVAWSGNAISHKNIDHLLKLVYILICYIA